MSYQVELSDKSSVEKVFSLKIEAETFNNKFQKELSKVAGRAHLKGFRPGRAPRAMVAKMYGGRIHSDIVTDFVQEALRKTIDDNNLSLVGTSDFQLHDVQDGEPVSVSLVLSLYPEPEIASVDGLPVEVVVSSYSEDMLEERLNSVLDMYAELKDVEDRSSVEENDFIIISYTGSYSGESEVEKEGDLKGESQQIELGKGQMPEDIEKALIGMGIGETREILHTIKTESDPESTGNPDENPDANPDAPKEILFKITLEKIQKKVKPELSDELAKKTGAAETSEELRSFLEKDLKRNIYQKNRQERDNALVDAVVRANDFEIPQELLDREIRYMLAEMRLLDPSSEDFHRSPVDQYREILRGQAEGRVKRSVVVEKLLKDYEISSTPKEVEVMLDEISKELEVSREELNPEYGYPSQMDNLVRLCSVRKLTDMLEEKMKITETDEPSPGKEK